MLTYRNTSIAFLGLLVLCAVINILWPGAQILLVIIPVIYLGLLVFGSVFVCSGFYIPAFCHGEGDEHRVALSFDDGPDAVITAKLLDLLDEHGIKAAFFCIGKRVDDHPEIVARMAKEGHLIGNHSWSHSPFFDIYSASRMENDLEKAESAITLATGTKPGWFRPPFGVTNPSLASAVRKRGYKVMGWSVRSFDTSTRDPEKIMNRIKKRWEPGAIILLHDTDEKVLTVVRMIIEEARTRGYKIVRADHI